MHRKQNGFTIVELLIVIVVIGILAAIVIVAFNGIQQQAKNTQTINATTAWIKAIKLYNAETGSWPGNSCFGKTTTYSGENGQCWDSAASWIVQPSFLTALQPYIGSSYPEPDATNLMATGASGSPKRGAFFHNASGGIKEVYMMLANTTSCPELSSPRTSQTAYGNGVRCIYRLYE